MGSSTTGLLTFPRRGSHGGRHGSARLPGGARPSPLVGGKPHDEGESREVSVTIQFTVYPLTIQLILES
jgi:hypothetical protein